MRNDKKLITYDTKFRDYFDNYFGLQETDGEITVLVGTLDKLGTVIPRELTPEEDAYIQSVLSDDSDYRNALVQDAVKAVTDAFALVAREVTGEPVLTPTKLEEWRLKFEQATAWAKEGKPAVTADNYPMAYTEAQSRTDQYTDPDLLIQSWLDNGTNWHNLIGGYNQYQAARRAWVRDEARTLAELEAVTTEDEIVRIKTALGLT